LIALLSTGLDRNTPSLLVVELGMTITRTSTKTPSERFAAQEELLRAEVEELNVLLGLDKDAKHRVTFGYIGNGHMTSNGWDLSNCIWSVFLPHPGRVGTREDTIGYFSTGNLDGIVTARHDLRAFTKGVRFARGL
jgi:hypothetical protein